MTAWEWKVVVALVRYVLAKENMLTMTVDTSREEAIRQGREDRDILLEVIIREESIREEQKRVK